MRTAVTWGLRILLCMMFVSSSLRKFLNYDASVNLFVGWGYPTYMCALIGCLELLGAVALLVPRMASLALSMLICIMIGAVTTMVVNTGNVVFPSIVLLLLAITAGMRTIGVRRSVEC